MSCEVKTYIRDHAKHDLWAPNMKTGNYLPGGCEELITFWASKLQYSVRLIDLSFFQNG